MKQKAPILLDLSEIVKRISFLLSRAEAPILGALWNRDAPAGKLPKIHTNQVFYILADLTSGSIFVNVMCKLVGVFSSQLDKKVGNPNTQMKWKMSSMYWSRVWSNISSKRKIKWDFYVALELLPFYIMCTFINGFTEV